jgi:hypothetical protein
MLPPPPLPRQAAYAQPNGRTKNNDDTMRRAIAKNFIISRFPRVTSEMSAFRLRRDIDYMFYRFQ